MIKAVIFDCFGVLSSEGWQNFKVKYFKDRPEALDEALRIRALADKGHYTHEQVMIQFAELANIDVDQVKNEIENYQPDDQLFSYIENELLGVYKIGMLSNVSDDWLYSIFTEKQLQLFDTKTLSFKIGVAKPDPRAYEAAANQIGVLPSECLFIDDIAYNVFGAKKVGMQAVQYEIYDRSIEEIQAALAADTDE